MAHGGLVVRKGTFGRGDAGWSGAWCSSAMDCKLDGLGHIREHHGRCTTVAHRALGADAYHAAVRLGAELGIEQAVSYATQASPTTETAPPPRTPLTKREYEIGQLVADGLRNREIATRLVIAQRTAETHVGRILAKLGFTRRTQIASWATERRPSTPR